MTPDPLSLHHRDIFFWGGGGARQDLRSTNGTFVVDAKNGAKDRVLPKKTTMLPEDGCQIYFGAVFCKVSFGRRFESSRQNLSLFSSREYGNSSSPRGPRTWTIRRTV